MRIDAVSFAHLGAELAKRFPSSRMMMSHNFSHRSSHEERKRDDPRSSRDDHRRGAHGDLDARKDPIEDESLAWSSGQREKNSRGTADISLERP
jgi:hypothetical protein